MSGKVYYLSKSLPIDTIFWIYTGASIRFYEITQVDATKIAYIIRE
jgi:hypothetical protein